MTNIHWHSRYSSLLVTGTALLLFALAGCGRSKTSGTGGVAFRGGDTNANANANSNGTSNANGTANANSAGANNAPPTLAASLASLNSSQPVTTFGPFIGDEGDVVHDSRTTEVVIEIQCNINCDYDSTSSDGNGLKLHDDQFVKIADNRFRIVGHWVAAATGSRSAKVKAKTDTQFSEVQITFTHTVRTVAHRTIYRASNQYDWILTEAYGEGYNAADGVNGYNYNWSRAFEIYNEEFQTAKTYAKHKLVRCRWVDGYGQLQHFEQANGCDPDHGVPLDRVLGYVTNVNPDPYTTPYPGMVPLFRAYHVASGAFDGIRFTAVRDAIMGLATQAGDVGWRLEGPLWISVFP